MEDSVFPAISFLLKIFFMLFTVNFYGKSDLFVQLIIDNKITMGTRTHGKVVIFQIRK